MGLTCVYVLRVGLIMREVTLDNPLRAAATCALCKVHNIIHPAHCEMLVDCNCTSAVYIMNYRLVMPVLLVGRHS